MTGLPPEFATSIIVCSFDLPADPCAKSCWLPVARTALSNNPQFGTMLPVHHQRHSCVLEHMARNTAQDQLTEARVRIGTHYEQVTGKFIGRRQQPCANHVVYSLKWVSPSLT